VPDSKREDSIKWLEQKAGTGIQIFWIAPLIEESEKLEISSVKNLYKNLKQNLPDLNIELLHGKLKPGQKQKILKDFRDFKNKKINTLISTSVIEVGIDIPNANIIVIEAAERFGLAQLHQLRGRVGRSDQDSWCFLFTTTKPNDKQRDRLKFFCANTDGFKLAEFDLHSRGPGEVYGTRQSGIPNLKIANIFDVNLLKETKTAAGRLLNNREKL
jgi:ATP-dependent DNA helicase RecG